MKVTLTPQNHLASDHKQIVVYPYNEHEGGGTHKLLEKVRFLQKYFEEETAQNRRGR